MVEAGAAVATPPVVVVVEAPNWNVLVAGAVAVAAVAAPQLPNRDLAGVEVAVLAPVEAGAGAGWLAVSPPNRPVLPPVAGVDTVAVATVWPKTLLLFVLPKMFVKLGTAGLPS